MPRAKVFREGKEIISFVVTPQQKRELAMIAKLEGKTLSELCREIIIQALEEMRSRYGLLPAVVEVADGGALAPLASVQLDEFTRELLQLEQRLPAGLERMRNLHKALQRTLERLEEDFSKHGANVTYVVRGESNRLVDARELARELADAAHSEVERIAPELESALRDYWRLFKWWKELKRSVNVTTAYEVEKRLADLYVKATQAKELKREVWASVRRLYALARGDFARGEGEKKRG